MAIRDGVQRVGGSELYSPIRTGGVSNELVEVLKKRIFKGFNDEERVRILSRMNSELGNTDVFGQALHFSEELRRSYPPFHPPEYVEVLRTIIERTGLQRTRTCSGSRGSSSGTWSGNTLRRASHQLL